MNILEYSFFQNALLGSLLASVLCGFIGTYIVTRRLVFISGGITHASFGGIGLGVFLGINPILSAMVFSVLSAFGVQWMSRRGDVREDSAIAVFWTFGMSLGIICCFLSPGFMPDLPSFLFGSLRAVLSHNIKCGFRCRLRPFATPARGVYRVSDDGTHRPNHRRHTSHGGHSAKYQPTYHTPDVGQRANAQLQAHDCVEYCHRLGRLPYGSRPLLRPQRSVGRIHYLRQHPCLSGVKGGQRCFQKTSTPT